MPIYRPNNYHKLPDIVFLETMYVELGYSTSDIANIFGVTSVAVGRKMKRHGIKLRTVRQSLRLLSRSIDLSNLSDFLDGLILGDGCLRRERHNSPTAVYSHTDKHGDYISWLATILTLRGLEVSSIWSNTRQGTWRLYSRSYKELAALYKRWYPLRKKRVPFDLELSPDLVANWYIGDGSYRRGNLGRNGQRTKKSEAIRLCTEFDPDGRTRLSHSFEALDIQNSINKQGLYIRANSREMFFDYLLSCSFAIPRCYWYKFPDARISTFKEEYNEFEQTKRKSL